MRNLKPVSQGLAGQVAQTIRRAILSGEAPLGAPLREAHLAKQLRVSQTTIREALVELGQSGLVVRHPQRRTVVTKLSDKEVRDRLAIRLLLEGLAWEQAACAMTDDDFRQLNQRLQRIGSLSERADFVELAEVELEFHRFIWEKSGNPTLQTILEQLTPPLFIYVTHQRRQKSDDTAAKRYRRHREVLRALRSGGRRQLRETLKRHLTASYGSLAKS